MTFLSNITSPREEQWIYISDLMAGLMIIFLFMSILLISDLKQKVENSKKVEIDICKELEELKEKLSNNNLKTDNQENWGVTICKDNDGVNIRFDQKLAKKEYFALGQSKLKPEFKQWLDRFNEDLLSLLIKHKASVDELRIEGHADRNPFNNSIIEYCSDNLLFLTKWINQNEIHNKFEYQTKIFNDPSKFSKVEIEYIKNTKLSNKELACLNNTKLTIDRKLPESIEMQLNYLKNTHLSVERSRSVLRNLFKTENPTYDKWKDLNITAHGFSTSKIVGTDSKSRRVEFRIILKEQKQVVEAAKNFGQQKNE